MKSLRKKRKDHAGPVANFNELATIEMNKIRGGDDPPPPPPPTPPIKK